MNRVCTARTLPSLRELGKSQCSLVVHMGKPYPSYGLFGPTEIPCSVPVGPKEFSLDRVEICNIKISASDFKSHFNWSQRTEWEFPRDPLLKDEAGEDPLSDHVYKEDPLSDHEYEEDPLDGEDPLSDHEYEEDPLDGEDPLSDHEYEEDPLSVDDLENTGDPFNFYKYVSFAINPKVQISQLHFCWEQDPLTTLKLICNLRSVRGAGRAYREEFYTAAIWLYKYHPKTLAHNVRTFAEFGYLKDLLEILYRILEGPEVRYKAFLRRSKQRQQPKEFSMAPVGSMTVLAELIGIKADKENARLFRKEKIILMAKRARDMYNSDENYRFLHDQIADLFAQLLKSDIEFLKSGNIGKISLAAKWCPSLNSSYDRVTLLCESIAKRVFPYDSVPEYRVIEDAHYAYRIRDRLRKQVLVPLRKALRLPEVYMSTNQWNLLPYHHVSSLAIELMNKRLLKHDKKRFLSYRKTLKMSQTDIILRPPKFTDLLRYRRNGVLVEMQYMRMVEDLRKKGIFQNCIVFYAKNVQLHEDLKEIRTFYANEMIFEAPYWIGLLVSELSESPWKGKAIGCHNNPQILKIEGNNLESKLGFLKSIVGDDIPIDICMVFDKILETALDWNLSKDKMVKRVIIYTDLCSGACIDWEPWDAVYETMRNKFESNGYSLPHVLVLFLFTHYFRAVHFEKKVEGITFVEFLAKNTINQFVEADGSLDPISLMESAISGEEFKKLQVHD